MAEKLASPVSSSAVLYILTGMRRTADGDTRGMLTAQ